MTYPQAVKYLNSFVNYEKNINYSYPATLKLTRIQEFLAIIGNPQKSLRIIHVAGTKGKGSTCATTAYILRAAGFSVGLYTSPHLSDFRERIRILWPLTCGKKNTALEFEGMISRQALLSLVEELKPVINKYNRSGEHGPLSFFEVYTALALLYFKRKQADFVVLETGMGGRLDATNACDAMVCGIAPVSFEHVDKLGHTLAEIAVEKSGIIKQKNAIVISALQAKAARKEINQRCQKFQARFYEVGRQIKYDYVKKGLTIKGFNNTYEHLQLKLIGAHQAANAALAVGLVEGLSFHGVNIPPQAIRRGVQNTVWPGRCELVHRNPLVILDGAQNVASALALKRAIRDNFAYRKLVLVLGISSDKDIRGVCSALNVLADEIILTRANTSRAADPARLAGYFKRKSYLTSSVKEAALLAQSLAVKADLILVTGSLFVVGEYRNVGR